MRRFEVISSYKDKEINMPKRATSYSAGYDIEAAEDIIIPSFFKKLNNIMHSTSFQEPIDLKDSKIILKNLGFQATRVPTGLKVYVEPNEYLRVVDRSSIGTGSLLVMPHSEGIIDKDYADNPDNEGHIMIGLINLSPFDILIKKGDKIAQGIICRYRTVDSESAPFQERVGGFGSTND